MQTEKPISTEMKDKIGLFCNVDGDSVVQNLDAENIYEIPLLLHNEGLDSLVIKKLAIKCGEAELSEWTEMVDKVRGLKNKVTIALVGKYVELHDAYMSVAEALKHAGIANDSEIDIRWIHSGDITEANIKECLDGADGVLVPGGFGNRGIEGKILAARYSRENKVPYFGICLGMQLAVVEFARNVLGLKAANTQNWTRTLHTGDTPYPEQQD